MDSTPNYEKPRNQGRLMIILMFLLVCNSFFLLLWSKREYVWGITQNSLGGGVYVVLISLMISIILELNWQVLLKSPILILGLITLFQPTLFPKLSLWVEVPICISLSVISCLISCFLEEREMEGSKRIVNVVGKILIFFVSVFYIVYKLGYINSPEFIDDRVVEVVGILSLALTGWIILTWLFPIIWEKLIKLLIWEKLIKLLIWEKLIKLLIWEKLIKLIDKISDNILEQRVVILSFFLFGIIFLFIPFGLQDVIFLPLALSMACIALGAIGWEGRSVEGIALIAKEIIFWTIFWIIILYIVVTINAGLISAYIVWGVWLVVGLILLEFFRDSIIPISVVGISFSLLFLVVLSNFSPYYKDKEKKKFDKIKRIEDKFKKISIAAAIEIPPKKNKNIIEKIPFSKKVDNKNKFLVKTSSREEGLAKKKQVPDPKGKMKNVPLSKRRDQNNLAKTPSKEEGIAKKKVVSDPIRKGNVQKKITLSKKVDNKNTLLAKTPFKEEGIAKKKGVSDPIRKGNVQKKVLLFKKRNQNKLQVKNLSREEGIAKKKGVSDPIRKGNIQKKVLLSKKRNQNKLQIKNPSKEEGIAKKKKNSDPNPLRKRIGYIKFKVPRKKIKDVFLYDVYEGKKIHLDHISYWYDNQEEMLYLNKKDLEEKGPFYLEIDGQLITLK